jgi:Ribbon-helix-helix protein, copG family
VDGLGARGPRPGARASVAGVSQDGAGRDHAGGPADRGDGGARGRRYGSPAYGSMAIVVKVTFTLDEATIAHLRRAAARLRKPQSRVVREAIAEYAARTDRLSDGERQRMLAVLDRAMRRPPSRTMAAVAVELREVRAARRRWGPRRRHATPGR